MGVKFLGSFSIKMCPFWPILNATLNLEYTLHALLYSTKTAFLKQKNVLHFISMTVLVLEIFKFKNFRILNLKRSSNAYAWNKKSILLNKLGGKHSLVMTFVQFVWYYQKKTFIKVSYKNVGFQTPVKHIFVFEQGTLQLLIWYLLLT